jgi:hypothetical protein
VGLTHNLSVVMPGLVPGTHVFRATKQGVGGRDKRAFTPVFAGYARPLMPISPSTRLSIEMSQTF